LERSDRGLFQGRIQHSRGETEENHERLEPESRQAVTRPRVALDTSRNK